MVDTLRLGAAFPARVAREPDVIVKPTVEDLRTEQLLAALARLHEALVAMPQPVLHVSEPDLTDIVNAVNAIKTNNVTVDDLAAAVREGLGAPPPPPMEPVLKKLVEALDRLDFRLKGISSSSGGGGGVGSRVQNAEGTALDTREQQVDTRYEWQSVAATSVPLFIGTATPGTATTSATWRVDKYAFITGPAGDAVPSVVQTAVGAWDNRASLF